VVGPSGELQIAQVEKFDHSILVVEDEVLVRMMLADQLREAGYRVVEASDADEALELLQHDALDVKVVVSDVQMPGSMDGIELARVIRSKYPFSKILLVSGHHRSLEGPYHDGFFPKPYYSPAIVMRVKELLG
jgi:two-component system, response regulator PdtaR